MQKKLFGFSFVPRPHWGTSVPRPPIGPVFVFPGSALEDKYAWRHTVQRYLQVYNRWAYHDCHTVAVGLH